MALPKPNAKEQPIAVVAKQTTDATKLTAAKQKDAVAALLEAHPEVLKALGVGK